MNEGTVSAAKQEAKELHKPVIRKFLRRVVQVKGIDDTWAADLVDMSAFAKENHGFKWMLTVIDVLSRYAWAVPIGDKSGRTVLNAFKSIIETSGRHPNKLWIDQGKEFLNKDFKSFFRKVSEPAGDAGDNEQCNIYHTFGETHAAPIERFNRTLKTRMWYKMTKHNSRRWIDRLEKLVKKYNNTVHSAIGMTPTKASDKENEKALLIIQEKKANRTQYKEPKYKVGDIVRLAKTKGTFEKGYTTNWTTELFKISKVLYTKPITYKVEDLQGEEITGSFYEKELLQSEN